MGARWEVELITVPVAVLVITQVRLWGSWGIGLVWTTPIEISRVKICSVLALGNLMVVIGVLIPSGALGSISRLVIETSSPFIPYSNSSQQPGTACERPPSWVVNHSEETLPRISETTIRMQQQKALLGTRVPGRLSLSEDWRAECGVFTLFIELGSNKRGYRSEKRADWLV